MGDYRQFRRAAHLRYVPMPGGEKAVREPWRMAAAHLAAAGCDLSLLAERIPIVNLRAIEKMLDRSLNSPMTSSAGRLFDAVASIAGLRDCVSYEGQAAMELEWLADGVSVDGEYPFELEIADDPAVPTVVDTRPIIRAAAHDVRSGLGSHRIARRFHSTMVTMITQVCRHIADYSGLTAAVLSGGVFMNAIISTEVNQRLVRDGFRVYRHRTVPANDGGLSLGQLAVAARSLSRATCTLPARSAIDRGGR